MIGFNPGIEAQANGGTHMPFEDIALMKQIPNINIIEPSDFYSAYHLIKQLNKIDRPSYIRIPRKSATLRYDNNTKIELGKAIELLKGNDVAIISTGMFMVNQAMKAAQILKDKNINATVIDLHTIKPLDTDMILDVAQRCNSIVICENGRYAAGVGEMISNYLVQKKPVKMRFVSVNDKYGEVGDLDYLANKFNLTYSTIVEKVLDLIG
ncbi:MAG: hypothetical protein EOL97_13050 [Spirochaetia bacterium]|nr:hypothetical protein [Spirochaetia bacterium]